MPDTYENQTQSGAAQPDGSGAQPAKTDPQAGEDRAFASRPSDTEAAHHNEGGHSWRSQTHGDIGGDMGRDASKGPSQGETGEGGAPSSGGGGGSAAAQADLGGDYDRTYNPDGVEANRLREQGGGYGEKDLRAQSDPTRGDTTDQFGDGEGTRGGKGEEQA